MFRSHVIWVVVFFVAAIVLVAMMHEPAPAVTRTEAVGEPTTSTTTQSCSTSGFCLKCGMDFDGDFSCGFKLSAFCPGERQVSIEEQLYVHYYEDGTSKEQIERKVTPLTSCELT